MCHDQSRRLFLTCQCQSPPVSSSPPSLHKICQSSQAVSLRQSSQSTWPPVLHQSSTSLHQSPPVSTSPPSVHQATKMLLLLLAVSASCLPSLPYQTLHKSTSPSPALSSPASPSLALSSPALSSPASASPAHNSSAFLKNRIQARKAVTGHDCEYVV